MSNKLDFYKFCKVCEERGWSDSAFKQFQLTHPGVLWRKVGKSNYQVSFRRNEGWLDVTSFSSNLESSMIHDLIVQLNRCGKVFSTEELLRRFNWDGLTTGSLIKAGIISEDQLFDHEKEKELSILREEKMKLQRELNQWKSKCAESTKSLERMTEQHSHLVKVIKAAINFIKDNTGFTGLSKEQSQTLLEYLKGKLS